jgi:hypothetical protein
VSAAKRRAKKAQRAAWNSALEARWAEHHAIAFYMCPCGYRAWLGRNATAEERDAYDQWCNDHDAYCATALGLDPVPA